MDERAKRQVAEYQAARELVGLHLFTVLFLSLLFVLLAVLTDFWQPLLVLPPIWAVVLVTGKLVRRGERSV